MPAKDLPTFNLIANLRAALERRRISFKAAANMCNRHPDTVQRIFQGHTSKLDAHDVEAIATALAAQSGQPEDRVRFLQEVFEIGADATAVASVEMLQSIKAQLDRIEGRSDRLAPVAFWIDDAGNAIAVANGDFRRAIYSILGIDHGGEDIVAFARRNLGYASVSRDAVGSVRIAYDADQVSRATLIAARDWLMSEQDNTRKVWRNADQPNAQTNDMPGYETFHEAIAALERRILAATPIPAKDWRVDQHRISRLPQRFSPILRYLKEGASPLVAVAQAERLGHSNIYSVVDGEALALHIGGANKLPTARYVGRRVLDRPTERDYAALVDRHVVAAHKTDTPTLHRLNVVIQNKRRDYWRMAMRDPNSNVVVTTSWEPEASET
jgi:hypothetical protein